MEVRKIATFSADEVKTLMAAGSIARGILNGRNDGTLDALDAESADLIKAVNAVLASAITTLGLEEPKAE